MENFPDAAFVKNPETLAIWSKDIFNDIALNCFSLQWQ
jgi:hypothetical protein